MGAQEGAHGCGYCVGGGVGNSSGVTPLPLSSPLPDPTGGSVGGGGKVGGGKVGGGGGGMAPLQHQS